MFTSKGIKIFCNVVAIVVCVLSLASMLLGVLFLALNLTLNSIVPYVSLILVPVLIGGGFIFLILTIVWLYPLYAMAHISEKLESIEEMVADLAYGEEKEQDEERKTPITRDDKEEMPAKQMNHSEKDEKEVVEFINNKYNINLHLDDSFDDLQSKIQAIEDDSPRAMLLIKKVSAASNKSEVLSALQMHKVTHS